MPSRRAVRATRTAISPRLAMRILSNMLTRLDPVRRSLLQERVGALLTFAGYADARNARGRIFGQSLIDRSIGYGCNEILRFRKRMRAALQQLIGQLPHASLQRFGLDDVMHEADAQRLLRIEALGGEEIAARIALSHRCNDIWADDRRDQTEPHFGKTEYGRAARTSDVAACDQPNPAPERRALHAGNGRLAQRI